MTGVEEVVLLSESGQSIGTHPKATVHHRDTPLHLAFSCYLFDADDRLLVTRRAIEKLTWPGVWTNTCCGHPGPGEDPADAVVRRVQHELGLAVHDLALVLPDFRYRAVAADGTVENEVCPVYVGRIATCADDAGAAAGARCDPSPDPAEVMDWKWVAWSDFVATATRTPWALSPWAALQVPELTTVLTRTSTAASDPTKGLGWTATSTSS